MMAPASFGMGQGEVLVGISAILLAIANLLTKIYLKTVPLGIFSVMRTRIGTIVFFILAQILYVPHHFMDIFSPFLWGWVMIYSLIIVVIGQLCWFNA
jgi:drug/metabolite transporter (DMT)-like permease